MLGLGGATLRQSIIRGNATIRPDVLDPPEHYRQLKTSHFSRAVSAIANGLLPQDCLLCQGSTREALLCDPCLDAMPRLPAHCPQCALPNQDGAICGACIRRPPHFDASFVACRYEFPFDRLMQAYKYGNVLALATLFSALLAEVIGDSPKVDMIIPLPLAPKRLRERGFNQSQEIARKLGVRTGIQVDAGAAIRVRETAVQVALPIGGRARNVRNAFSASAAVSGGHRTPCRGSR